MPGGACEGCARTPADVLLGSFCQTPVWVEEWPLGCWWVQAGTGNWEVWVSGCWREDSSHVPASCCQVGTLRASSPQPLPSAASDKADFSLWLQHPRTPHSLGFPRTLYSFSGSFLGLISSSKSINVGAPQAPLHLPRGGLIRSEGAGRVSSCLQLLIVSPGQTPTELQTPTSSAPPRESPLISDQTEFLRPALPSGFCPSEMHHWLSSPNSQNPAATSLPHTLYPQIHRSAQG